MDFVDTTTGKPVNSPFQYELWEVPSKDAHDAHLYDQWPIQIYSVERYEGIPQEKIRPGEERFILNDGHTFLLKRPGKNDVRFTVPIRRQKRRDDLATVDRAHVLPFPTVLSE